MATQFSVQDGKPWKSRFFTIWGGQALSILGSQLVQFALIWHLTVQTGSATVLATAATSPGWSSQEITSVYACVASLTSIAFYLSCSALLSFFMVAPEATGRGASMP